MQSSHPQFLGEKGRIACLSKYKCRPDVKTQQSSTQPLHDVLIRRMPASAETAGQTRAGILSHVSYKLPRCSCPFQRSDPRQRFSSLPSVPSYWAASAIVLPNVAARLQNVGVSLLVRSSMAGYPIMLDLLHVAQRTLKLHHMRWELY